MGKAAPSLKVNNMLNVNGGGVGGSSIGSTLPPISSNAHQGGIGKIIE